INRTAAFAYLRASFVSFVVKRFFLWNPVMTAHFSMLHPHFTPDINLGHLVQAVVVVATVGGGVLGGYLSLRSDLDLQRAEFRVVLAGHEARLNVAERVL